jgi:hypothetical protein
LTGGLQRRRRGRNVLAKTAKNAKEEKRILNSEDKNLL